MTITSYKDNLLEVVLNAGHAEYTVDSIPKRRYRSGLKVDYWIDDDPNEDTLIPSKVPKKYHKHLALDGWEGVYRIRGDLHAHARGFTILAAQLDPSLDPSGYTPGGDDDFFDYWPSGMLTLRLWAIDLDQHVKDIKYAFYGGTDHEYYRHAPGFLSVYHNVIRHFLEREYLRSLSDVRPGYVTVPWYESEIVHEFAKELADDLNVDIEEVAQNIEAVHVRRDLNQSQS